MSKPDLVERMAGAMHDEHLRHPPGKRDGIDFPYVDVARAAIKVVVEHLRNVDPADAVCLPEEQLPIVDAAKDYLIRALLPEEEKP